MPLLNNTTHQTDLEIPVARFFENKREVAAVYLFGSHASGRQRPESDVDIGILLCPEFLESGNAVREECIAGLGRILRKDIHPVILNHAGEVLLKQVLSAGKPVLISNPKVHTWFAMISLSRILDFQPYLEQMQNGFAKKITRT